MKKKLMILLIAALFVALIFSTGCKKKFDITGTWTITLSYVTPWPTTLQGTLTAVGDKSSGTATIDISGWDPGVGTYTVSDTSVTITVNWTGGNSTTCSGTAPSDNSMNGNITETYGATGTWTATR